MLRHAQDLQLTGAPVGALGPGAGASLQEQGTGVFNLSSLETAGSVIYNGVGAGAYTVTDRNYNILYLNTTTSTFTWTLAADRTLRGTGAATLNIGALRVTLAGGHNIILTAGGLNNNTGGAGVLDAGGNSIIFTGTGAQYISANAPLSTTTFTNTNIIVNNGAGGSVNGNGRPIIIDGSVTITSGLVQHGWIHKPDQRLDCQQRPGDIEQRTGTAVEASPTTERSQGVPISSLSTAPQPRRLAALPQRRSEDSPSRTQPRLCRR